MKYTDMVRNRDAKIGKEKPSILRLAIIELSDELNELRRQFDLHKSGTGNAITDPNILELMKRQPMQAKDQPA